MSDVSDKNRSEAAKIKLETMAQVYKGFYVDLMPRLQQIKNDAQAPEGKSPDGAALARINKNVSEALKLLEFLNKSADIIQKKSGR